MYIIGKVEECNVDKAIGQEENNGVDGRPRDRPRDRLWDCVREYRLELEFFQRGTPVIK